MNCLLKAYEHEAQRGVPMSRDELVVTHLPLVKFIVDRIASSLPPHLDRDDLRSAAVIGLISAAERFDPSRGVQFKTFAEQRIRGTIMDELRAQDWLTRSLRDKFKKLEKEFSQLEQRLGRNPSSDEVATAMGLELKDYFRLLEEIHLLSFVSLDDAWHDEDGAPFGLLDVLEDKGTESPQSQLIARQTVERLAEAIDSLPEKERIVITLYYYEELNLKEIGAVLDLTESRISQLHSQAIVRLRGKMKRVA
ncbi:MULTISPECIES: FliA/WhiG family RNA polymerase sigma factor [Geomonas]|uniref:FliA/WhiG family RNA polymerase sigma factor n=4 Tax=Geomonas TaxID=2651583 RepID=A0ABY4LI45_9BACT|nr:MULTISPECIES: FliA/WhiG family RNA polymerase sigma factor [Geomonas]MBJ6801207.1 FliA/WhiG family RNA polymerase sigma factor [Geomonas propionica]MBU5638053.1 FliA/WhiG family RNA polymerase sigma factor [Geomonas diazotrophica]QWV97054.1 FliA/WhiG family RNA polymerase sigma factor [Geomonas nitrogeniifigens]QXE86226.1 FliA/WhiG family RNA polymerase sigma factor [Geomonas nitrogeniifigens]QXE90334.1 FliA/WhiG family RNA polymerase sigma factor [Geomonas subterranea]